MLCEAPIAQGPMKGRSATGTAAGYKRHHRAGDLACSACLVAWREVGRRYEAANPTAGAERRRRFRQANPEHDRLYYEANRERLIRRKVEWAKANPEKVARIARRWQVNHRTRVNELARRRKASKVAASLLPFTAEQLTARMEYWGNRCWVCGGPFEHVDHVKPLAKGGAHILANLRPACSFCNISKHDRWEGVRALPQPKGA